MYTEQISIAYDKSNEVCKLLHYRSDRMISTQDIVEVITEHYCKNLQIHFVPFDDLKIDHQYGAMMHTTLDNNGNITAAIIIVNSSKEPQFQRFSLLHEIGHLVTKQWGDDEYVTTNGVFVISTHIDYSVTNISEEEYTRDKYLLNEQIANIFALRVLMPSSQYYDKMKTNNVAQLAEFFGLTEEAVISRAMIGA